MQLSECEKIIAGPVEPIDRESGMCEYEAIVETDDCWVASVSNIYWLSVLSGAKSSNELKTLRLNFSDGKESAFVS